MKKIYPLAIVALMVVSCKKNYTCVCIQTINHPTYGYSQHTYESTINDTKTNAEGACKEREVSLDLGVYSTASCVLK